MMIFPLSAAAPIAASEHALNARPAESVFSALRREIRSIAAPFPFF
jgi:hypothetical protein